MDHKVTVTLKNTRTFQQLIMPQMGKTKQTLSASKEVQHEECHDKRLNNHIFTVAKVVLPSLKTYNNSDLLFVTSDRVCFCRINS